MPTDKDTTHTRMHMHTNTNANAHAHMKDSMCCHLLVKSLVHSLTARMQRHTHRHKRKQKGMHVQQRNCRRPSFLTHSTHTNAHVRTPTRLQEEFYVLRLTCQHPHLKRQPGRKLPSQESASCLPPAISSNTSSSLSCPEQHKKCA